MNLLKRQTESAHFKLYYIEERDPNQRQTRIWCNCCDRNIKYHFTCNLNIDMSINWPIQKN